MKQIQENAYKLNELENIIKEPFFNDVDLKRLGNELIQLKEENVKLAEKRMERNK